MAAIGGFLYGSHICIIEIIFIILAQTNNYRTRCLFTQTKLTWQKAAWFHGQRSYRKRGKKQCIYYELYGEW
mgnify:CR=1 FL=1